MTVKLCKMSSNDRQKIFHINVIADNNVKKHVTLFADILPSNGFKYTNLDYTSNRNSLYTTEKVYHNMYDSTTPYIRSNILKTLKTTTVGKSSNYINKVSHIPELSILNSTLIQGNIYMIEPYTNKSFYYVRHDLMDILSSHNGIAVPELNKVKTTIYDKDKLEDELQTGHDLDDNIIKQELTCIKYNTIHEFDNITYNNYDGCSINAHSFKCKNNIDSEWNMIHDDSTVLSCARRYTNIDSCGNNIVYTTYYDVVSYDKNEEINDSNILDKFNYKFPNIEVINKINRLNELETEHPANVYSINLTIDALNKINYKGDVNNKKDILDSILQNVKNEIRNCVRSFSETLLPANTELFNIYINGSEN